MAGLVVRAHLEIYFVLEVQLLFVVATATIFLQPISFPSLIFPSVDE